jgi:hypothetical protein
MGGSRTPPPPEAQVPTFAKVPLRAWGGPGAGAGVHGVAAEPRGSPHKPGKRKRGERGLSGVERYAGRALRLTQVE